MFSQIQNTPTRQKRYEPARTAYQRLLELLSRKGQRGDCFFEANLRVDASIMTSFQVATGR